MLSYVCGKLSFYLYQTFTKPSRNSESSVQKALQLVSYSAQRGQSVIQSIFQLVRPSINPSVSPFVNKSVGLSVSHSACQPVCQQVSLTSQPISQPVSRPSTNQSIRSDNSVSHSVSQSPSRTAPPPPPNPCNPLLVVMDSFTYGRVAILSQAHKHHCVHGVGVGCLFLCLFSQVLA